MNIFTLILKQMRQRALSTWLTLLSVTLGVALAVAILVLYRESQNLFGQRNFGYDSLIGKKGSKLQLVINTIYHLDVSPGNIPISVYGQMSTDYRNYVKIAVPFVLGDTLDGKYPIVGTLPKLFGYDDETGTQPIPRDQILEYRAGQVYEFADGRCFAPNRFESVLGSDVAELSGLKIGDTFRATHTPAHGNIPADIHPEQWKVVGILKRSHTANDKTVWIPMTTFYTIAEHGVGLIAQHNLAEGLPMMTGAAEADAPDTIVTDKDGTEHHNNYILTPDKVIKLTLDPNVLALSGIMVQSRGGVTLQQLQYATNNGTDVMDVNPASEMRDFLDTFLTPSRILLLVICSLVTVVAAVGILVSIYNSVSARGREIAIFRALGATRQTVLAMICLEAGFIGVLGCILGHILGHAVSGVGSVIMEEKFGQSIDWLRPDAHEGIYLLCVVILAVLAGLVPALKAYTTPVATNLVAS